MNLNHLKLTGLVAGLALALWLPVSSSSTAASGWITIDPAAAGFRPAGLARADEHIRQDQFPP